VLEKRESMGLNLLEKTELWINNITLKQVNLSKLSEVIADVLELEYDKVLVVDVRESSITMDILQKDIALDKITGKEKAVLTALEKLPGVTISSETYIHSNGILGLICLEGEDPKELDQRVGVMVGEISSKISRRAMVFPTGFELRDHLIEDTNSPYLKKLLTEAGYYVEVGGVINDKVEDIELNLNEALSRAFGLIITTGGVGAEDKDHSVEGILRLDREAATPYLVKFTPGTGRHVKDGVRLAVGQVGPSLLVALPGPHDEVRLAAGVLLTGLKKGMGKAEMAQELAKALQQEILRKMQNHHGTFYGH